MGYQTDKYGIMKSSFNCILLIVGSLLGLDEVMGFSFETVLEEGFHCRFSDIHTFTYKVLYTLVKMLEMELILLT